MPKRRPNYRLVKIHRSYTVEEIARLFDTHKNTVRLWIKAGLPTCDTRRPTLILGYDLAEFLKVRRMRNKPHASRARSTACAAVHRSCQPQAWRITVRKRLCWAAWWASVQTAVG